MSKRISLIFAALVLVCALSACGSRSSEPETQPNGSVTEPDTPASDSTHGQTDADALPDREEPVIEAPDTTPGTSPNLTDDPAEQSGVSLDQMLKNARVHDTDGKLLDGENRASY